MYDFLTDDMYYLELVEPLKKNPAKIPNPNACQKLITIKPNFFIYIYNLVNKIILQIYY